MPLKIVESFGVKLLRTHHSLVFLSGFVLHLYLNLYFMRQCNIYLSVCGAFCRQGRAGTGVMVAVIHALHYTHHYHTTLRYTSPHSTLPHTALCSTIPGCQWQWQPATLQSNYLNTAAPHRRQRFTLLRAPVTISHCTHRYTVSMQSNAHIITLLTQ